MSLLGGYRFQGDVIALKVAYVSGNGVNRSHSVFAGKRDIKMSDSQRPSLVRLGDTDLTLASNAEDIRGHEVVDRDGKDLGTIDALMVDERDRKIRFLHVAAHGSRGDGEKRYLIPVDAVLEIEEGEVHVDETRERILAGPTYDASMASRPDYWEHSYQYYGIAPFWNLNP